MRSQRSVSAALTTTAAAAIAFFAGLPLGPSRAQDTPADKGAAVQPEPPANKDWPCKQILVDQISLPAVWSGPSIDSVQWRDDGATADLVAEIAARKTTIETAEKEIESFAAAAGSDKNAKLTALFAGAFETLNRERSDVIEGLMRFSRKQKALASKIRAENAAIQNAPGASRPEQPEPADNPAVEKLQWDIRLFDEGRKSLTYACEAPTLIEQRLFAVARSIQNAMD
ncbi:conserved hypothetical protein [Methylocella silvestris BL2]|uniref:Secreted protein n=1 Tax=Methylocella silvestris (strain DSM 15510 / CIP 108128 / LMG 27833 / NCIMB 13906 / BL2) TaxID=395965 RepID=B8EI51_METSB|nr:hypothetical protein [Methylocella silvestris]ACK50533.1 conserved hypothetical protein [Methylocella silvestris BL2]